MIAEYARSEGRWRHAPRIRQHYGYRTYSDYGVAFRLNRFLYALCWTGSDRPSALFDRAVAWLLEDKVLLPGLSVLERAVARVRTRANRRLHRLLIEAMTPEQRERLDSLVAIPEVPAKARSTGCVTGRTFKADGRSAVHSAVWKKFAPTQAACRRSIGCHLVKSRRWRGLPALQRLRPFRVCRPTGARQPCWPLFEHSKHRPGMMSSICSTPSRHRWCRRRRRLPSWQDCGRCET